MPMSSNHDSECECRLQAAGHAQSELPGAGMRPRGAQVETSCLWLGKRAFAMMKPSMGLIRYWHR